MFFQNFCSVFLLLSQIVGIWSAAARNESLLQSRVFDGHDADINDAHFVVSVRQNKGPEFNPVVTCGGSLISDNVVLTAAHCLLVNFGSMEFGDAEDFEVVMGNLDCTKKDENTLIFQIKKFVRGELSREDGHDIALLFLKDKVPPNHPTAKPVILSSGPLVDAEKCKAYGWGENSQRIYPDILQVGDLLVMTKETCSNFGNYYPPLVAGMFCGGNVGKGPGLRIGDMGGPFVCKGVQIGIASFLNKLGIKKEPVVFTDVAKYKTWILKQVLVNRFTKPTFSDRSAT